MDTKKESEYKSNQLDATKKILRISLKQSNRLQRAWKICENQRLNRLHSNGQTKQIACDSRINTMFLNPRRRKLYQKRVHQGHNQLWNLAKMPCVSDNQRFKDTIYVQNMRMKSAVVATMWNEYCARDSN